MAVRPLYTFSSALVLAAPLGCGAGAEPPPDWSPPSSACPQGADDCEGDSVDEVVDFTTPDAGTGGGE